MEYRDTKIRNKRKLYMKFQYKHSKLNEFKYIDSEER